MITDIYIHHVTGLEMRVDDLPEPAKGCSVITIKAIVETPSDGKQSQAIKLFAYDPEVIAEIAHKVDMFNSPVPEPKQADGESELNYSYGSIDSGLYD